MEPKPKFPRPTRIKIISTGNAESGKSCIIKRYCEKRFVPKYLPTIGIDYGVTHVTVEDKEIRVNIFDMSGLPIFYEVRNEFYKDTQGILLVYDVTDRASFQALNDWLEELKHEIGSSAEFNKVALVLCANKVDKHHRVVDETEGRKWAEQQGFSYFETSANMGEGISDMFQTLFMHIMYGQEHCMRSGVNPAMSLSKEQLEIIRRLEKGTNDYERLGLRKGAGREEINRAYRKLAVLLHPDKTEATGAEEAFKLLVAARANLMKNVLES